MLFGLLLKEEKKWHPFEQEGWKTFCSFYKQSKIKKGESCSFRFGR